MRNQFVISGCVHFLISFFMISPWYIENYPKKSGCRFSQEGSRNGMKHSGFLVYISSPNTQPLQHFLNTYKNISLSSQKNWDLIPLFFILFYLLFVLTPSHHTTFILSPSITYNKQMSYNGRHLPQPSENPLEIFRNT